MKNWEESLFLEGKANIQEHFRGKENVLMIVGKGFDPRACVAVEALVSVLPDMVVYQIDYDDRTLQQDEVNESRSEKNEKRLEEICQGHRREILNMRQYEGPPSGRVLVISENVRKALKQHPVDDFKEIIIDISAMPRAVAFSIIKRLYDIKTGSQKISIIVCENSACDDQIEAVISEGSAEYLTGFETFSMSLEAAEYDTVWIPILGMREEQAFHIISNYLKAIEICPVVPFPASDIGRGEKILRLHGDAIFRERDVEKRNIIYVPEKYPLLIYQKLYDTVTYYEKAFSVRKTEERSMKYAFSSQASKLMDIGMLLAVMDLCRDRINTGIVVVDNQGYQINGEIESKENELYCLCLDDNEFGWD